MRELYYLMILAMLAVSLVGCGSGAGNLSSVEEAGQSGSALQGIPRPGEIALRTTSELTLALDGSSFEPGLAGNVTVEGTTVRFAPDWANGELAYAVYRFNLAGFNGTELAQVSWGPDTPASGVLWVGFSDWSGDCWEWFQGNPDGTVDLGAAGYAGYIQAGTGDLLMAVVLLGSTEIVVTSIEAAQAAQTPVVITGITPDPAEGEAGTTLEFAVQFTGTVDDTTTYAWEFDGGAEPDTSTEQNPTVELGSAGSYDCQVTVDNDYGDPDIFSFSLEVISNAQGGWWCFGYDQFNTRRCPFTGPQTDNVKWDFQSVDGLGGSVMVATDGTLYFGTYEGVFYAFNPDGTEQWSYTTGGAISTSPVIAVNGTVYFGSDDGNLYALNPDGTLSWEFDFPQSNCLMGSPILGPDGALYFVITNNDLYVLDPAGTERLKITTLDTKGAAVALGSDGTIYVVCNDNRLYAMNADGTEKWSFYTGTMTSATPTIAPDGTVYLLSWETLYALNPDGTEKWSYAARTCGSSAALAADGTVIFGGWEDKVMAVNSNGTLSWEAAIAGYTNSCPIIGADGVIYIGGGHGTGIYALTAAGNQLWSYPTTEVTYYSPTLAPDGTMYIGCADGKLYAFGTSD